jgi:predicted Rossmann fold nucleotide-binding protein DprA/Smf involved in DNA uptake
LNIPESQPIHLQYLGNADLLQLPKTAFLCSRHISASAVLKCYDWASEQRRQGVCVIGGFHSPLEKDVFQILIKGSQPLVMVLGRAMYKNLPEIYQTALLRKRLLIVSVAPSTLRHSTQSAFKRNKYIIENAQKIVFGWLDPLGELTKLYENYKSSDKQITIL